MKNIFIGGILLLLSLTQTLHAQTSAGRYQARLVHNSYNHTKDSAVVCLQIRSTSVDSNFIMGNSNFLIQYTHSELDAGSATIRSRGIYSGGNYSTISLTPNPGTTSSVLSVNVVNIGEGGAGQLVDTTWRMVACIAFSQINNPSSCYSLTLSSTNPSTVVTKAVASSDPNNPMSEMIAVSQGALTSITNNCPVSPIVSISGGGTINVGGSSSIVISSTNNILPATVNISENIGTPAFLAQTTTKSTNTSSITVQLTAQSPTQTISVSPNQTTTYTIASVAGEFGTGSANPSQQSVVVNVINSNCTNVKCSPITVMVIK